MYYHYSKIFQTRLRPSYLPDKVPSLLLCVSILQKKKMSIRSDTYKKKIDIPHKTKSLLAWEVEFKNASDTGANSYSLSHVILSSYLYSFKPAPMIYTFTHDIICLLWTCPLKKIPWAQTKSSTPQHRSTHILNNDQR